MTKDRDTEHGDSFEFNEEVTGCFSNMLERSIPAYELMRDLTTRLAFSYMPQTATVIDIGMSTGETISKLLETHKNVTYIGLENSEPMLKAAKERFVNFQNVHIRKHDLRESFYLQKANVIISSLTIQFTPIEYRLQILQNIANQLADKGAFIFIEKVIGSTASLDKNLIETYYGIKKENGYSEEESLKRINSQMPIDEKREKATWVIDNSKNLKHLQQEVEEFVEKIKGIYL